MTPEQALGLRDFLVTSLKNEMKTTARVIGAVPDDKASYRPHETSKSAQELADHIATVDVSFLESVIRGSFDNPGGAGAGPMAPSQATSMYQEKMPKLIDRVATLTGEELARPVQFYTFNLPAVLYLDFALRHCIHHRGQLSTYLRPMGAKVPSIYGGSADEPFDATAASAS